MLKEDCKNTFVFTKFIEYRLALEHYYPSNNEAIQIEHY